MTSATQKQRTRRRHPHSGRSGADARLVAALAAGATYCDVANAVGVSISTVTRRMASPAFRQQVEATRRAFLDQAVGRLASRAIGATEVLHTILNDAEAAAGVRLNAAKLTLELCLELREKLDLAERLARVEEALGLQVTAPTPLTPEAASLLNGEPPVLNGDDPADGEPEE